MGQSHGRIENDDCVKLYRKVDVGGIVESRLFFKDDYPSQFRGKISIEEWYRLNEEFKDIWNSSHETQVEEQHSVYFCFVRWVMICTCCLVLLFPPFWCMWYLVWACWDDRGITRYDQINTVVKKANKYIFVPRGMFMGWYSLVENDIEFQRRWPNVKTVNNPVALRKIAEECCDGDSLLFSELTITADMGGNTAKIY